MAHGSPDWHKLSDVDILAQSVGDIHINIAGQDIAQIINRPTYGEGEKSSFSTSVAAMDDSDLVTITGTGIIYGGYLYNYDYNIHSNDIVTVTIDGNQIFSDSYYNMNTNNLTHMYGAPVYLTLYDTENYKNGLSLSPGFTFESNFVLNYNNPYGNSTFVKGMIYYATI
jgi:hypothetical protein